MLNCYRFAHIKMFRISHKEVSMKQESYFDSGLLSYIEHNLNYYFYTWNLRSMGYLHHD